MSKTFIFKRNRSQDMWRPVQQTPNSRRRSLTRERESSSTRAGVYKSEFPLHESLTRSSDTIGTQLSPSMRRVGSSSSPGERHKLQRHRDLKRKFIFQLHEEIEKPIHTTVLEEISDLDRITSICLSTLHQMMENKHQRKFLHHMNISNNNNSYFDKDKSDNSSAGTTLKGKKNYDKLTSEIPERQDSKTNQTVQRVLQESIQIRKQMATPRKESIAPGTKSGPPKVKQEQKKLDMAVIPAAKMVEYLSKQERAKNASAAKQQTSNVKQFKRRESSTTTLNITGIDDFLHDDAGGGSATAQDQAVKALKTMNPLEALHCKWIRLSKDQVATLEKLCRDQGIEPGIHAHSDVANIDVFREIRDINKAKTDANKK